MSDRESTTNDRPQQVTAEEPCIGCGKPDWCMAGDNYVRCNRGPFEGSTERDGYWDRGRRKKEWDKGPTHATEPLPRKRRHEIYTAMSWKLDIRDEHVEALKGYLTREEMLALGYRSTPEGHDAEKAMLRAGLACGIDDKLQWLGVPGAKVVVLPEGKGGRYVFVRYKGSFLPYRDRHGLIVGWMVRRDDAGQGGKYKFVSGDEHGSAAEVSVHVPLHEGITDFSCIRVTEGIKKADVATLRTGVLTLGLTAGVDSWRHIDEHLGAWKLLTTLVWAFDADAATNPKVATSLADAVTSHKCMGRQVVIETWDPAHGKGIDDVLAAGKGSEIRRVTGVDIWPWLQGVLKSSGAPPKPLVDAWAVLDGIGPRLTARPQHALEDEVIDAIAAINTGNVRLTGGTEFDVEPIKAIIKGKGWSGFQKKLKAKVKALAATRRALTRDERLEEAEEKGLLVFNSGSNADIAGRLVEVIAAKYSPSSSLPPRDRLVMDQGTVWAFDEGSKWWVEVTDDTLSVAVQGFEGSMLDRANKPLAINGVGEIIRMFKARVARTAFFDNAPRGVAFTNGFAQPSNGRIVLDPLTPGHRVRWGYDFDFIEIDADNRSTELELVAKYFRGVFQGEADIVERISVMGEHAGVCILGQATRFNAALVLFDEGGGGTGKSQWLNIVMAMFPPGTVTAVPPHQLGGSERSEYYRARCAQSLINIVNEIPDSDVVGSEAWKAICDGNKVSCRDPGGKPFMAVFRMGQLYACNGLPGTQDQSDAFFDRWIPILFKNRFRQTDGQIQEFWRVIVDAELPAIVCWALGLAATALERGSLTIPPSSREAIKTWRGESDVVAGYISEQTEPGSHNRLEWASLDTLWCGFKEWSEKTRRGKTMGQRTFQKRLKALLGEPVHLSQGNRYPVRLKAMAAFFSDSDGASVVDVTVGAN